MLNRQDLANKVDEIARQEGLVRQLSIFVIAIAGFLFSGVALAASPVQMTCDQVWPNFSKPQIYSNNDGLYIHIDGLSDEKFELVQTPSAYESGEYTLTLESSSSAYLGVKAFPDILVSCTAD